MLLNNDWVNNEIKEEIKKFQQRNGNEHTTVENLWDTVKVILRVKFIAIQAYLKKTEMFQINILHQQELEEEQTKSRVNIGKEIIKIRAELSDIKTERRIQKINKSRSRFFEMINISTSLKQTHQQKNREDSNKQNQKLKR